MCAEVHPVVNVRLTGGDIVVDEQLCVLLRLVDETGSIGDSCRKMDMPLPSAWYLLARAEDALGVPLLRHLADRSVLTEKGRKLTQAFEGFQTAVQARADVLCESLLRPPEPLK